MTDKDNLLFISFISPYPHISSPHTLLLLFFGCGYAALCSLRSLRLFFAPAPVIRTDPL